MQGSSASFAALPASVAYPLNISGLNVGKFYHIQPTYIGMLFDI